MWVWPCQKQMGFGLCRWSSPILTPASSHHPPSLFPLQEVSFGHRILYSLLPVPDCSKCIKDRYIARSSTFSCLQPGFDKYPEIGKISYPEKLSSSPLLLQISEKPTSKETCTSASWLPNAKDLQFSLLMENLSEIEGLLGDSCFNKLKQDILVHIGRLGALELFEACLYKSFPDSSAPDFDVQNLHLSNCHVSSSPESQIQNIVHPRKKEIRKLQRKKSQKNNVTTANISPALDAATEFDNVLSSRTMPASPSGSSKSDVAQLEIKLAEGVKEAAILERICRQLEAKTGSKPTLSEWAEAAGIDKEVLQQRLQYGSLCKDRLLKSIRSLVIYLSKNYTTGRGICFEDLVQAGNMGVLLGAERFDSSRGYKFSTYAQYWIRNSMSSFVAKYSRVISIPKRMEKIMRQIRKVRMSASSIEGHYLNDEEIAEITGISLANIRLANQLLGVIGSSRTSHYSSTQSMDEIADTSLETPETAVIKEQMRKDLYKLLDSLHPREKQVLMLRYGLQDGKCRSLAEISAPANVSRVWINKVEKAALSKLRKKENFAAFEHYLQHDF